MALNFHDHPPVASAPMSTLYNISVPSFPVILHEQTQSWLYTTVVILLSLLAVEQAVYRYKKGHLPGAKWTIPIIGKFTDSMNPTMEGYKKQWDSGALSAVSVFNM
jgi:C-22 sterol desaturase